MDLGSLLIVWLIFAVIVGVAAASRGRNGVGWFLLAILISPLLALILVLVISPGGSRAAQSPQAVYSAPPLPDPRKPCPQCGEQVPVLARICRFCRYEFKDMSASTPGGET